MGRALEVISGRVTAPGATLTALTMAAGNSLTVRNTPFDADIRLIQMWVANNAAGIFRVRSPKLHDNVQGIRARITATDPEPLMPAGWWQKLIPQDTLIAELSGSAVGGQIEQAQLLIYYSNLPGADGRLFKWGDILPKVVNLVNVEVAIAPGAAGGYSGQVALNATFDLLKANTDYALLGGLVDAQCAVVRVQGPDFGNLGVGFPGNQTDREQVAEWFVHLAQRLDMPLIPVFNSANKAGTLVDVAQNQAAGAVNVNLLLAELAPGLAGAQPRQA